MLIQSNKKYAKYVHMTKSGKKVVYLKLLKALYGTITAARLFFENITEKLTKYGFVANGYDSLFPEPLDKEVSTPTAKHLFEVNPNCEKISEHDRKLLHSIVAKLLYVATKGRPDIYLSIAF